MALSDRWRFSTALYWLFFLTRNVLIIATLGGRYPPTLTFAQSSHSAYNSFQSPPVIKVFHPAR